MAATDIAKPLGVFVVVIAVILAGTALVSIATGSGLSGTPDGENVQGQSPEAFQPANVNAERDPETGELTVDGSDESKQILIDTQHSNQFDRADIEPVVETLTRAGHDVDFTSGESSGDFGGTGYNATLQQYDALLVIQPTGSFTDRQRAGIQAYTEGDGRVVVLGEPTQMTGGGGGLLASPSQVQFGANELTQSYGARIGSEVLINVADEHNDNNFKAVDSTASGSGSLTDGVDEITFDTGGYIVTTDDSDAEVLATAAEGTETLDTRRTGSYATAVRNGNFVFVADSDILHRSEVYDADNEVFVSNLLTFLTSGDKADDVPQSSASGSGADDGF